MAGKTGQSNCHGGDTEKITKSLRSILIRFSEIGRHAYTRSRLAVEPEKTRGQAPSGPLSRVDEVPLVNLPMPENFHRTEICSIFVSIFPMGGSEPLSATLNVPIIPARWSVQRQRLEDVVLPETA